MYLNRLQLTHVRGFESLDFDFERPDGSPAGWSVVLGGNASGKSTLLKAAALAMLGPDAGRELIGSGQGWIRNGAREARIEAEIAPDPDRDSFRERGQTSRASFPAAVRWELESEEDRTPRFAAEPSDGSAERGPWNPNAGGWFLAGYGPMRRLSGASLDSGKLAARGGSASRVLTLFMEDAVLSESEEWLKRVHARTLESGSNGDNASLLEGARALLGDGLFPHGLAVSRITVDRVFVRDAAGIELPMREISDGCRCVYSLVLSLIHSLAEVYGARDLFSRDAEDRLVVDRPGVVLIDELEAHLHPSWQRDLPVWLKTRFPGIQFLATTHSPLVAQAADPGGVYVLPLQDEIGREPRRLAESEYEKIRWGRAEKTLLGVAFGLHSSRSHWADRRIREWMRLNAKRKEGKPLRPEEDRRWSELRENLRTHLDPPVEL